MKRVDGQKYYYGVYRGIVIWNKDPMRIGRCKLRIPSLHGTSIKPTEVPWAMPMQPTPCAKDSGSFIAPEEGDVVWVMFEGGDKNHPLFQGGYHGVPKDEHGLDQNEAPLESLNGWEPELDEASGKTVFRPRTWTLFKSRLGTTIAGRDQLEKEAFWFIDRVGQVFQTDMKTRPGTKPREDKQAMEGHPHFTYDDLTPSKKVSTIFKSFGTGFIKFISEEFKERIGLVSKNRENTKISGVNLNSEVSNVSTMILAEDKDTANKVYIKADATNAKLSLVVEVAGVVKSSIELDEDFVTMTEKLRVEKEIHTDKAVVNNIHASSGELSNIVISATGSLVGSYSPAGAPSPSPETSKSDGIEKPETQDLDITNG